MSDALKKQLTEKRQQIWDQSKALLDAAANEKRELTAEENQQFETMSKDMTDLRANIDRLTEFEEASRAAEEALRSNLGNREQEPEADGFETQLRSFLRGEKRDLTISADAVGLALRALQKGAPTEGGNTVPTTFDTRLVEHMVEASGIMQAEPTVLNTTSGENIEVPVTTSHGAAGLIAEEASIAAGSTDPAFGKRTLGAYKYGQIVTVARELVEDTAVDLLGYIARIAGRNVGLAFGAHLVTGDGSNKPTGLMTTATAGKTGAAAVAGVFTADDLIDLMFSVIAPYRNSPSASWLMKDATLAAVRKLKDGDNRYLFSPAATVGAPDTLLGKPIRTDPNVAAVAAGAKSVAFGDMSAYFVRLAGGVRFERSDHFAFNTDQVAFRAIIRGDGLLVDQTGAVKTFTGGAVS